MPENIRSHVVLAVIALILAAAILIIPFITPLVAPRPKLPPGYQIPSKGGMVAPSHQQARVSLDGSALLLTPPVVLNAR
jgi:hypothetical protein